MTDTVMAIIGIVLAVLIMFIFPVVAIASQHDEIAQATVEAVVADFVNTISEKGKITEFDYNALIQKIHATGNTFDVQIEVQLIDDNPERKTVTTSADSSIRGENLYYSVYTENITQKLRSELAEDREYNLKKDDYVIVTVKNTNISIGTQFKNFFYKLIGKDTYTIGASSAALVTNSGKEEFEEVDADIVIEDFEEKEIEITQEVVTGSTTTTVTETNVTMVVILDSARLCTNYHAGRVDSRMFTSINSIYSTLNSTCDDFYLGFIETAHPTQFVAECSKNNPPNTSQITGDEKDGENWNTSIQRAINKIESKSAGKETTRILIFMSWGSGVIQSEISDANQTLATKKNSIDKFYTMGCCGSGSIDSKAEVWYETLGNKSGGHLAAGILGGAIQSGVITSTQPVYGNETRTVKSENGRLLLDKLDRSKEIKITINEIEYIVGQVPLTANNLIVYVGGKYYLDLKNLATAIGKDNLNDTTIKVYYHGTT